MLPKIRPAAAGSAVRPSIRPVKPSPPPPPPAPPRRYPSGIAPKNTTMQLHPAEPVEYDDGPLTAVAPYSDAPTNPTPEDARATNVVVSFEDETQARAVDEYLLQSMRPEEEPQGELAVPYESLPSLEARRPFDTYEAEFAERDPVTQMVAAHESIRLRRGREVAPPPESPNVEVQEEPTQDDYAYTEPPRDGSGPRVRPSEEAREDYAGYAAPLPAYDDVHESYRSGPQERSWESPPNTVIPPAPAVPREMRGALPFIQGVQPIRPANNFTPYPQPIPQQLQQMQQPMIPTSPPPPVFGPMPGQRMVPTSPSAARMAFPPMQPVGAQVQTAKPSGVGRFAWFVFGAAFGIAFAFVATGYVPKLSSQPDPLFPPAPPKPVVTATAQPPSAAITAPPPVVTAPPVASAPTTPSSLPAAKDPPPKPAPSAKAPPPPVRRFVPPPRRPAPPPPSSESAAPKRLPANDAPDPPSAAPPSAAGILDSALSP